MPLHDWAALSGWDGVHQVWIVELLYWVKPRLPAGYRAYIGTTPTFAIGAPADERPDMGVRTAPQGNGPQTSEPHLSSSDSGEPSEEPDQEIAVATLASDKALFVEYQSRLIAAVELVSPRNMDRPSACGAYASNYVAYLLRGVNLLLVDVHRHPLRFSFADRIAEELQMEQPPCPAPFVVSYRVGEPVPNGGRFLGIWRQPLAVGAPLRPMRLALSVTESVVVDLDQPYGRATAAAYLT
jgi:hypothetical protein